MSDVWSEHSFTSILEILYSVKTKFDFTTKLVAAELPLMCVCNLSTIVLKYMLCSIVLIRRITTSITGRNV